MAGTSTPYARPGQRAPGGTRSHRSHSDHSTNALGRTRARTDRPEALETACTVHLAGLGINPVHDPRRTCGGKLPTDALVVAVVATLVVYWLAEEYADLLGEQVESGSVPTWDFIRGRLDATWPMVSASYLPLLALVLARVAGLSPFAAANVGLITAVLVLMVHAWAAGRSARLRGRQLLVTTSIAAGLGLAMILLKDVVLTHVH